MSTDLTLTPLAIEGVWRVDGAPVSDERGSFTRTFDAQLFAAHGLDPRVAQTSVSKSPRRGTLRGMHLQAAPHEEAKLVRCTRGRVFDVALDLRPASTTYCRWLGLELAEDAPVALYLGPGIAHGFLTLSDDAELAYQISTPYVPSAARAVRWDDSLFAIAWPSPPVLMSERDRTLPDYVPTPSPMSTASTARRLTKGFLATLLAQLITAIGNIVLVPVFLTHWGEQRYGEWLVLYAAVAYMTVVDFGLQTYVVNRLTQAHTRGEMHDYHRLLHSAFRLSLAIASAVVALTLLAFALPLAGWLDFVALDDRAAAIVVVLLGVQLVGAVPQALIAGVYRTLGEYHRGVMIGNVQRALGFALTAAVMIAGGTPSEVAAVQLAPLALATLFVWVDLARRHRGIRLGVREGSLKDALPLLAPSFFFFVIQLAAGLVLQGTTLVVGAILGIGAVVVFTTTRTLANLIVQITGTVNATLWPDITALEAQGRYETLRELQRLSTKVVLSVTLAATLFLYFNGEALVRAWTQGKVAYDAALMTTFLGYVLYLGYANTTTMVLVAANRHRGAALLAFFATAAGIALAIPGALLFDNAGVIGAMLVTDLLIRGIAQSRAACALIAQPLGAYLGDVLGRGALVAGAGFAAVWGFQALAGAGTIGGMVVSALVCGVVIGALTFAVWLGRGERRRVLAIIGLARGGA